MDNFVKFYDAVNFKPLDISEEIKDYYEKTDKSEVKPLSITIAATHAGKITRNNGFYLPDRVQKGVKTFTNDYEKPILIHHEDRKDPIGRVKKATYIDLSKGFRNSMQDSFSVSTDRIFEDLVNGNLSFDDSVDFVNKYLINNNILNTDSDYKGLGYIEILTSISDPEGIKKVLDGRYLTGSVGATTNKAVCSTCKKDWAKTGKCAHKPGKKYDGNKCVIIAGDLIYDEYSFVNKPADTQSQIIEINVNGIQDFVTMDKTETECIIPEISLVIDHEDHSEEDQKMTFKDAFALISNNEKYKGLKDVTEEDLVSIVKKIVDDNKDLDEKGLFEILDKEITIPETDLVKIFWNDEYDEIVGDDAWGKNYAEMMATEEFKDAKLTAEDRKALPKSVFCKGTDGYPVNDISHAKSAWVYAKKNNESPEVISCIRRKAARLGCPFGSDVVDSTNPLGEFVLDYFDHFSDEELGQLFSGLKDASIERSLSLEEDKSFKKDKTIEELEKSLKDAEENSDKILSERLKASRKEISYLHTDIENLTTTMADTVKELRDARIEHVVSLHKLNNKTLDIKEFSDEVNNKNGEEIRGILKDLNDKVDIGKIIDTLNSGLSNNPTGTVEDPTLVVDNLKKPTVTEEMKNELKLQALKINTLQGHEASEKFLQDCKAQGIDLSEQPVQDKP